MLRYIHELEEWPEFEWRMASLAEPLSRVRFEQGLLLGRMEGLGFGQRQEVALSSLVEEVRKSSEIEGENLDEAQVRSSLARRLGLDYAGLPLPDRNVDGVVEMTLDATQNYAQPLTAERLCSWQAALFPTGYSGMFKVQVGRWRDDSNGPMQVVSGPIGRERVHFEAPEASRLDAEMARFLDWFESDTETEGLLKAGLAHLWFVTIHPFEDGNGRIARTLMDMALARSESRPWRGYSMSAQIRKERSAYYRILESTQKGGLDVTSYLAWFLDCLGKAIRAADSTLSEVLSRARFWQSHAETPFNERQRLMLLRLLDGFEGKLTNAKWAKMAKCSHDTALRDLRDLVEKGVLLRDDAGRSTSYALA